jgi:hypothetical protein
MADQLLGIGPNPSAAMTTTTAAATSTTSVTTSKEKKVRSSFAHAASYIMLAYALQPGVKIYEDSVIAIQRLLPLPYIRTGLLLVAAPGTASTPEEHWIPAWFALDSFTLLSIRPPPAEADRIRGTIPNIAVDVVDVGSVDICRDPSLPRGWPIFIGMKHRSQLHKGGAAGRASKTSGAGVGDDDSGGMFLIAGEREEAEGWVDALRLIGLVGKSSEHGIERLQEALLTRRQRAPAVATVGSAPAQPTSVAGVNGQSRG